MRFIDLSVTIRNQSFEPGGPEIVRMNNSEAARKRAGDFNFHPSGYPNGLALAHERVTLSAHGGTHVDAPLHYGPMCEGKPSKTIEEVPLEWCYGPGVVLDFSHKKPAEFITGDDIVAALAKINHKLKARRDSAAAHRYGEAFRRSAISQSATGPASRWLSLYSRSGCSHDWHRRVGIGPCAPRHGRRP